MLRELLGWALLAIALGLAALAFNAVRPIRRSRVLLLPSFLAGTLLAETSVFILPLALAAAGFTVWLGEPRTAPVWLALTLTGLAAVLLVGQVVSSLRTKATLHADVPEFGRDRRLPWRRLLWPFPYRFSKRRVTRGVEFARVAGQRLRLDVYHPPASVRGPRPAVIHVHGGGWVVGSRAEQGIPIMALLSDRGYVCFNISYRLSPGATWPEHVVDVKRAIAWVRENADAYGVDPSFITIIGGSAGGHLTAMAALTQDDVTLQPGFEDADCSVQAAVPLYAVFDLTDVKGRHAPGFHSMLVEPLLLKAFYEEEPERFAAASPIHRVRPDAPPFFVIHGSRDSMVPLGDAEDFVAALREVSEAPVRFTVVPGAHHSFDLLVSLRSLPVIEAIGDWIDYQRSTVATR
ncbi:MAG: alpha/beta hydrolase fold domain-containing protein [Nannocystaceae bacterium]|nr:alpha/beta hydrolase [bacterium]